MKVSKEEMYKAILEEIALDMEIVNEEANIASCDITVHYHNEGDPYMCMNFAFHSIDPEKVPYVPSYVKKHKKKSRIGR